MPDSAVETVFVVYTPAGGESELGSEVEAVEQARGHVGAKVVRVDRTADAETRRRVWPDTGPVHRKAR